VFIVDICNPIENVLLIWNS